MSTTEADLEIDLDAADAERKAAAEAANGKKDPPPDIEVVKAEPPKDATDPEEGLKKIQKQLEDERRAREEAETRRAAAEADAQAARDAELKARTDSQDNQLALVTNAISAVKASNEALKVKYREARAVNDPDAEFEIQQEISANAAKLVQLQAGEEALKKAPKPVARPQAPDPVDQFTQNMSPRSAAWVRQHRDYVTDPKKNRAMIAAHELAVNQEGLTPDTDEYFASIEQTLRISNRPNTNGSGTAHVDEPALSAAAAPVKERTPPPAAAPVSRSGTSNGRRANTVTLTPAEVEAAEMSGLTPEEYAREKLKLQKERH